MSPGRHGWWIGWPEFLNYFIFLSTNYEQIIFTIIFWPTQTWFWKSNITVAPLSSESLGTHLVPLFRPFCIKCGHLIDFYERPHLGIYKLESLRVFAVIDKKYYLTRLFYWNNPSFLKGAPNSFMFAGHTILAKSSAMLSSKISKSVSR